MKAFMVGFRVVAGVVAGYAVMVLLITLVQEVIFGGVSYYDSPLRELVVAGLLTTLSAVAGGALAAWISSPRPMLPPLIMSLLVVVETTYLTLQGDLEGPLWFDIVAAASLIVGLLAGAKIRGWRL